MSGNPLLDDLTAKISELVETANDHQKNGDKDKAVTLYVRAARLIDATFGKARSDVAENVRLDYINAAHSYVDAATRLQSLKPIVTEEEQEINVDDMVAEVPTVRFRDIIGHDELKRKLLYSILIYINQPHVINAENKGCLMYGPPGTGKTDMARALCGELSDRRKTPVSFINVRVTDILNKWVGQAEKNVKAIFETARKSAPAILFFDEVEALFSDDTEKPNQKSLRGTILAEWSGFQKSDAVVFVLGATNFPWDIGEAQMRRFGGSFYMGLPSENERYAILKQFLKRSALTEDELILCAKESPYYSGSDLKRAIADATELSLNTAYETSRWKLVGDMYHMGYCFNCLAETVPVCPECGSYYKQWTDLPKGKMEPPQIEFSHIQRALAKGKATSSAETEAKYLNWKNS